MWIIGIDLPLFTQVPATAVPSEKFLAQDSETERKSDKPEGLVYTDLSF